MKKTGLFKILLFVLLGIVVTTWIFSASYYSDSAIQDLDMYNIGFFDFWQLLFGSFEFSYFIQILILIVSVGAFYGVLGKTGKYAAWVDRIAHNNRGNEFRFLVIISVFIALLSSVFDYGFSLFIFYPLIISIILAMGYDKYTALIATFGAQLVGTIGSTLGYNTTGAISNALSMDVKATIGVKIGLLAVSLGVMIYFLSKAKRNKNVFRNEKVDVFAGEKKPNKYSKTFIVIIFCLIAVMLVLGCTSWSNTFKVNYFTELKDKFDAFEVKLPYFHITTKGIETGTEKVLILKKIFGTFSALGSWYYAEMAVVTLIAALLVGFRYRVSNLFETMADGAKKMIKPGLMVMFAYTVVFFAGNTMFYPTIAELILNITGKFNLFFTTIVTALASALHVDMLYMSNYAVQQIAGSGASNQVAQILSQGVYGVTMLIAPTSAVLVLGLSYLGISYKEWVKKSWVFVLCLLAVVVVASIVTMYVY